MSQNTLPLTVKNFRPFDQLTPEQQREHLILVHGLGPSIEDRYLAEAHDRDHAMFDRTPDQVNEHTHTKKAPRTWAAPGARTDRQWKDHDKISDTAYFASEGAPLLTEMFEALADRGVKAKRLLAFLADVDSDDLWNRHVGPMLDAVEAEVETHAAARRAARKAA